MASINIAAPFMQLILGLSMVVSVGTQSYMGLRIGEGNVSKAQNTFKTFIIFIVIAGIIITILGIGFNEQIALFLGASDVLKESVCLYIKQFLCLRFQWLLCFCLGFQIDSLGIQTYILRNAFKFSL